MNDRSAVLQDALAALEQAAQRLRGTHEGLAELFPLTPDGFQALEESKRGRLDAYAIRYARCQVLLFPAMRALGRAQLEPKAEIHKDRVGPAYRRRSLKTACYWQRRW